MDTCLNFLFCDQSKIQNTFVKHVKLCISKTMTSEQIAQRFYLTYLAKFLLKYTCKSYLSFLCAMLHLYNNNLPGTHKHGNVTNCSIEICLCMTGFTDHTTENSTMYGCQIHFHTYLRVHVNLKTISLPTIDHRIIYP